MRFLIAISMCACAAIAQPALPTAAPRTVNLPVVGLASSESAQVNVVNLASTIMPVFANPEIASCNGSISFYDSNGTLIATSSTTTFNIGTNQIFSASVPYSAIIPADRQPTGNGRTTIRATVTINATANAPCSPAANIETIDTATGVTHVHVEGSGTVGFFPTLLIGR
jgi:hypothetical protein